jgi:hypothetical protein
VNDTDLIKIKERNARVAVDKAWETSWARRLFVASVTYGIAALYMDYAGLGNALLGAFVPTGGYLLSTLSLPFIKKFWIKNCYKNQES